MYRSDKSPDTQHKDNQYLHVTYVISMMKHALQCVDMPKEPGTYLLVCKWSCPLIKTFWSSVQRLLNSCSINSPFIQCIERNLKRVCKKVSAPSDLFWWQVVSKSLNWSRMRVICSFSLFVFGLFVLYLIQVHVYAALLKWLFLLFTSQNCFCPMKLTTWAYHVSEVCTEGASGLMILHHTVVVEDFSTTFTNRAEESSWPG